jgi:ribosomal peptide maturation radical SAM protein 1
MDMAHLTRLLPELIAADTGYQLFYEVKSNLTRAQVRTMAQAGVSHIQPGLESLSSPVLRLMRKGVRAAQNVNLLRWARYYGIDVAWNILWGFPGETESDYRDQTAAIPHLVHLQPPGSTIRIWMERFSPLFTDADPARISGRRPEPSYRYVYPEGVDLDRLAYFFEYETTGALPEQVYADLRKATGEWRAAWRTGDPPTLTYRWAPGLLHIHDDRVDGRTDTYTFDGDLAEIYRACGDRPRTAAAVRDVTGVDLPVTLITEAFAEFQQRGLMFLDGDLALSLALPTVPAR